MVPTRFHAIESGNFISVDLVKEFYLFFRMKIIELSSSSLIDIFRFFVDFFNRCCVIEFVHDFDRKVLIDVRRLTTIANAVSEAYQSYHR